MMSLIHGRLSRRWATVPGHGRSPLRQRGPLRAATHRLSVETLENRCLLAGDVVLHWNEILLQSLPGPPSPVPLSRNMAIVHLAMFDAVNAIDGSYEPYFAEVHASHGASKEAAAAQAAHDTLSALYPARQAVFAAALAEDLADIPPGLARQGVAIGQAVAQQILTLRSNDGSGTPVAYTPPNDDPGQWQPTPPNFAPAAAAHVPAITPFAVTSTDQFLPPPPPELTSPEYAAAYNKVKEQGSANSTTRTADQTEVALVWQAPLTHHQVWNRIAQDVAMARQTTIADNARLFALLDMAFNDALQTSFGSKYHYELWRPVTAIHHGGLGGPNDAVGDPSADGNPDTVGDPTWTALHATTPPYPTYAGNAATVGASSATVLADVFGSDEVPFTIPWDRYGFPGVTRSYTGFWAAADEAARSREYGGIHFTFDSVAGQEIGVNVAEYIVGNFLQSQGHDRGHQLSTANAALASKPARAELGSLPLGKAADGFSGLDNKAADGGRSADALTRDNAEFSAFGDRRKRAGSDLFKVRTPASVRADAAQEFQGDADTTQFADELFALLGTEEEMRLTGGSHVD